MQAMLPRLGLIMAVLGFLVWQGRGWQHDSAVRGENTGKAEVVAIVNDAALAQATSEIAALKHQRNAAWAAEEQLRGELEVVNADLEQAVDNAPVFGAAVPEQLLCFYNQAIDIERGETARQCAAIAAVPGGHEGTSGALSGPVDPAQSAERRNPQASADDGIGARVPGK